MKRNRISLMLLSLLVLTSVVGIFSMNGFAQSTDLNYTFQQERIYDYPLHQSTTDFNVKDNELLNYTQIYNGTYSFTGETGLTDTNINFVDTIGVGYSAVIQDTLLGHDEILNASRTGVFGDYPYNSINQVSGTIEFWFYTTVDIAEFMLVDGAGDIMVLVDYEGLIPRLTFYYGDGVGGSTTVFVSVSGWAHIKFEFDCTTDKFTGYANGIMVIDDENFFNDGTTTAIERVSLANGNDDWGCYDGFGYSWDTYYKISDNIIPLANNIEVDNEWEADRWIFSFNDALDDQYAVGSDVFSDWTEIDGGDDDTNIVSDPLQASNRRIKLQHEAPDTQDLGIERDFSVESGYINISWGIEFDSWGGTNEFSTKIYSYDDTLIVDVYFENAQLRINSPATTFISGLTLNVYYELNLFVNYDSDKGTLRVLGDGSYIGTYIFPLITVSKDGLGEIESFIDNSAISSMVCYLDYIGVYVNGSSLSTELAFKRFRNLEWNSQTWVFNEHNLISFEGYGDIVLWETGAIWLIGVVDTNLLSERYFVNDTSKVFNVYDHLHEGVSPSVDEPSLFVQFFNELNISDITIEGVKLVEGSNEYPLIYTHANIEVDDSYFYVDSRNRLRGVCHYNDSDLEYIQANFDINIVLNENRSLRFRSQFSGEYGFFSLSYIDATSSTINLPISITSHNIQLPQAKTIDEFVFLISDDDKLEAGYGSGLIYEIRLMWNPSISITILTINLIMIIIPLIILIVPTLTLYSKFGKSVIMPAFIFMAIICFAGGLIPAWLFFILMLGAGGFLVLKKGSDT